ncbi:unnamed protein product, partial [Discosporangium mesarthrocarpum]
GLVNSYLRAGKISEAGFVAKEAVKVMPKDARTIILNGNVWEHIITAGVDNKAKVGRGTVCVFLTFPLVPATLMSRISASFICQAKKAYEMALKLDPFYLDATIALAGLLMASKEYEACIQLLLKALPHHTRDTLYTKLAEAYTLNAQYDDALAYYHIAMRY